MQKKIGCVILSKSIIDLTSLESCLHAKNVEVLIHKDFSSNLQIYDSRVSEWSTRSRWGSPDLAFAMLHAMKDIFINSHVDYVFSISDNTIPSPYFLTQLKVLSDGFEKSLIESNLEEPLAEFGVNYGISSNYELGKWTRKIKLDIFKGNQWNAVTRSDFIKMFDAIVNNHALLTELYHTKILDERLFATMFERLKLPYNNVRYMYMPFAENGKNVREITVGEYLTKANSLPFMRKYNWDNPIFDVPIELEHKLKKAL